MGKATREPGDLPGARGSNTCARQILLAHKKAHPLAPFYRPVYSPTVVLGGEGGTAPYERGTPVPSTTRARAATGVVSRNGSNAITSRQCPVVTWRRVRRATCPPPPRRLPRRSPLPRIKGSGFRV